MRTSSSIVGLIMGGLLFGSLGAFASSDSVVTAVFSSVSNGYQRKKLPDGSVKPEYYAIAQGQYVPGRDKNLSIDNVPFQAIADLVAKHLAEEKYYFAQDSKSADILLLITWGTTTPFNNAPYKRVESNFIDAMNDVWAAQGPFRGSIKVPQGGSNITPPGSQSGQGATVQAAQDRLEQQLFIMQSANNDRFKSNEANARLLGYVEEVNSFSGPVQFSGGGAYYNDLMSDLEEERYYVIVSALDFRTATHEGKRKLLWATRVSISAHHNKFDDELAGMLAAAGRQFGKQSDRLLRRYREERINYGELKFMGVVPNFTEPNDSASKK